MDLFNNLNIEVVLDDKRGRGNPLKLNFLGELTEEQKRAAKKLSQYDTGVLAATTAFGKTVVGAYRIAKRKKSTLIIMHFRQLLD